MRTKHFFVALLIAIPIAGCATNPYRQFYVSRLNGQPVSAVPYLIPNDGEPQVISGRQPSDDELRMVEDGYELIGYANFVGPPQDLSLAKRRARELKAAAVLVYNTNPQTITETMPVPDFSFVSEVLSPKTETTRTTGTIQGTAGSASYSESSTKTLPPAKSTPRTTTFTSTRCEQVATFWVKAKPARLGILPRDLTADERAARGTNRGIAIAAVMKGSPAYAADLFRGDILMRIGEAILLTSEDLVPAVDRYAGRDVDLLIVRNGNEKTVRVKLLPNP
jgi:membrane-associated protease RseP (regulator of RpoE activity)